MNHLIRKHKFEWLVSFLMLLKHLIIIRPTKCIIKYSYRTYFYDRELNLDKFLDLQKMNKYNRINFCYFLGI